MIKCTCPECGYRYKVSEELAGKNLSCPECQTRFKVKGNPQAPRQIEEEDYDDDDRPVRRAPQHTATAAHSLGVAALVLGVLAFIVSLIPCAGIVGLPVGGLGLLLGIAGLIVALVRQGRGIGFPIAGSGVSLLAIIIALVWLGMLGSVSKSISEARVEAPRQTIAQPMPEKDRQDLPPAKPQEAERVLWDNVGNAARVGDVSVECLQARITSFSCKHWGEWKIHGPMLVVELKLTNTLPTKILKFAGWQEASSIVEDEHGNRYGLVDFGEDFEGFGDGLWNRWRLDSTADGAAIIARNLSLHPRKSYATYLFCMKPTDVSKEARLTLPAKALGGTGTVRLRVRIEKGP